MLQPISSLNTLKKGALCALLVGSAGLCSAKPVTKTLSIQPQVTELISKAGADALRANTLKISNPDSVILKADSVEFASDDAIFVYDSLGRVKKEYTLNEDKSIYCYYTYEYDNEGRSKFDIKYYPNDKIEWIKAYHYNKDNSRQELTIFDDKTSQVAEYDAEDNLLESTLYDKNGHVDLKYIYTTDKNGNRIETIFDSEGKIVE